MGLYVSPISLVHIEEDQVIKRFRSAEECAMEARWYRRFPEFSPEVVAHDGVDLVTRRYPVAWDTPEWRDAEAIVELLRAVHEHGVHHRDVHLRNIVLREGKPILIDWFTAMECQQAISYDLYGEGSLLPKPERHLDYQSWDTPNPFSIKRAWGIELSAVVGRREDGRP